MPASPCIAAIMAASKSGKISSRDAADILRDAQARAAHRSRLKGINVTRALREIAGELPSTHASNYARMKRNTLLNIQKNRDANAQVMGKDVTPGDGVKYQLLGRETAKGGFGGGMFGRISAAVGTWYSRLANELRAADVLGQFHDAADPIAMYRELAAQTNPTMTPGHTGNAVALKMAEAVVRVINELTARINAAGGNIGFLEGWMGPQTHDILKIRALGRESGLLGFVKPLNYTKARDAWKATEVPLWDDVKMIGGGGKTLDEIADEIFDHLWTDKSRRKAADEMDASVPSYGSLANRFASERVIHYKSPEAALAHESAFGKYGDNYAMALADTISSRARLLALLTEMGPAGKLNLQKRVKMMVDQLNKQPPSAARDKALKSLEGPEKFDRMYDVASGAIDRVLDDGNMVLTRVMQGAKLASTAARGGMMLVNSLGDPVFQVNQMTMAGVSKLDALAHSLQFYYRSTKTSAEAMHQLGLGSGIYLNEMLRSFGRDLTYGQTARKLESGVYSIFGMTHHTEAIRAGAATGIAETYGRLSSEVFSALPEDAQRTLTHYGITPPIWDAMRGAAHKITDGPLEGYTVLSHDNFHTISDATLDTLILAEGKKATVPNRQRMRTKLEQMYGDFLNDRVAAAASEPGGWEAWVRTYGGRAQRGTVFGELARPLFMFKSFPLAIARRNAAILRNRGPARAIGNYAFLLAGMTVAGYMSITARNLLRGQEAPKLTNEDGSVNWHTFTQSMEKGGGLGIYGSVLFGEYDRYGRGVVDSLTGPLYGQAAQWFNAVAAIGGEDETDQKKRADALRLYKAAEGSIPFQNLFYIKPALDHALFWNIREMISPGTLHRAERAAERRGEQWYIKPSEVAPMDFGERMEELGKRPIKAFESLTE